MNPSRPFILRPVATTLLMVAILLSGLIAYRFLPISALPEVDYPTIQVVTLYPGASPEIMTSSITAPLENQLGQIPGLNEMSSSSSGGASVITLQFSLQSNLDVAEQEVQAAINAAQSLLPNDLPNQPVFSKVNPADAPILTLAVMSDGMPLPQIQDLVDTRLAQKISQISGVGLVSISGGSAGGAGARQPDGAGGGGAEPGGPAQHGDQQQPQRPQGQLRRPDPCLDPGRQRPVALGRRLPRPDHRLQERLAAAHPRRRQRRGRRRERAPGRLGQQPAGGGAEHPAQPGANVIEVVDRIKALLPQLQSTLPGNLDVQVLTDRTTTIRASVKDVQFELALAVALVVMVTFLFLRNVYATLIPSFAVPLSLIGTFGVMYLSGFSINNLTLMALTIATGFVVDDAIVMVENIARYLEQGDSPAGSGAQGLEADRLHHHLADLLADRRADPAAVHGDVAGRLFREFAITLAVAILIPASSP